MHIVLRGTPYLERCREYEQIQIKNSMIDILGDENEADIDPKKMVDFYGCNTAQKRSRKMREILNDEVKALSREQRAALIDAADRRQNVFADPDIYSKI